MGEENKANATENTTVEVNTRDLSGRLLEWAVGQALHTVVPGQTGLKSMLDGTVLSAEAVKNFFPTENKPLAHALNEFSLR